MIQNADAAPADPHRTSECMSLGLVEKGHAIAASSPQATCEGNVGTLLQSSTIPQHASAENSIWAGMGTCIGETISQPLWPHKRFVDYHGKEFSYSCPGHVDRGLLRQHPMISLVCDRLGCCRKPVIAAGFRMTVCGLASSLQKNTHTAHGGIKTPPFRARLPAISSSDPSGRTRTEIS